MVMTVVALLSAATAARGASAPHSSSKALDGAAAPRHRITWTYPQFRTWQFAMSGAVTAIQIYTEVGPVPQDRGEWVNGYAFDNDVRKALRAESEDARHRAAVISDYMWYATEFYTVAIDSLLVPLAFDSGNTEVASQMLLVDWQTLGLAGLATRAAHYAIGRARPNSENCKEDVEADETCDGRSFFSGHTSMAMAGATLACAHHAALPLYGEGPWGTVACGGLVASASTVALLRVVADRHWPTDVLMGYVLGGGIGFGVPWLLHYQFPETLAAVTPKQAAWIPWGTADGIGLSLGGFL